MFVVGAVAVGDADVLPELRLERGVELVERGGGAAFELQGRLGRDRAQGSRRDAPVLVITPRRRPGRGIPGRLPAGRAGGGGLDESFTKLIGNLERPLSAMGTAFSASMFGLIGSLVERNRANTGGRN